MNPPLTTATILKITDIIASITVMSQDQPLPFSSPHANTNAVTPNAIDTDETPTIMVFIRPIDTIVTPIGRDLPIKTATEVYAFSYHKWFLPF